MLRFLFVRLGTGLLLGSLLAFAFGQSNSVEKSAKAIWRQNVLPATATSACRISTCASRRRC